MRTTEIVQKILSNYEGETPGVKANLARMLMEGKLGGTGRMIILPVDQGFEHGPARSFAMNPAGYDPHYHYQLAIDAGLNAFASPLGMLEAGADTFAGQIPTILKLNSGNSLMSETAGKNQAVTGSVFVDCTGDADVATFAGVPTVLGGTGQRQNASMQFVLQHADPERAMAAIATRSSARRWSGRYHGPARRDVGRVGRSSPGGGSGRVCARARRRVRRFVPRGYRDHPRGARDPADHGGQDADRCRGGGRLGAAECEIYFCFHDLLLLLMR